MPWRPKPAASCSGQGCDGLDPDATGCDADAVTGASVPLQNGALVEVRWSNTCQAAWARITSAYWGDSISITGPAGYHSATVQQGHDYAWTKMVRDLSYVETAYACGSDDGWETERCTAGY